MLVGGLEHEFYDFPYAGNFIIPTDFHIFQRGRHTTNQFVVYSSLLYFLLVIHGSCARMKTRGLAVEPIDYEDYGDVWNPLRGGRFGYVLFYEAH